VLKSIRGKYERYQLPLYYSFLKIKPAALSGSRIGAIIWQSSVLACIMSCIHIGARFFVFVVAHVATVNITVT
jgi:hypothetical protein